MAYEKSVYARLKSIRGNMLSRCLKENAKDYKYYGARGITVCDSWIKSLPSFIEWALRNGYKENLTLDRIDNNKGYCPENCRWVTIKEQRKNRDDLILIKIGEEEMCFKEWCDKFGLKYNSVYMKMKRGKTAKEAIIEAALAEKGGV